MKAENSSFVNNFTDIPNVGKATESDFFLLGILEPKDLIGKNAYQLFDDLCKLTPSKKDKCVVDVFLAAIDFMEGGKSKKWWEFTEQRKKYLSQK